MKKNKDIGLPTYSNCCHCQYSNAIGDWFCGPKCQAKAEKMKAQSELMKAQAAAMLGGGNTGGAGTGGMGSAILIMVLLAALVIGGMYAYKKYSKKG